MLVRIKNKKKNGKKGTVPKWGLSPSNASNAQSLAEYVLIVALVISAVIAMQVYVQRGLQARYRDASRMLIDKMRDSGADADYQYEPYYVNSEFTVEQDSSRQENLMSRPRARLIRNIDETTNKTGTQYILSGQEAD
ncbi:MAG: hypothetical protein ACOY3D_03850 [Candidatus Omnitrophota bacterium]